MGARDDPTIRLSNFFGGKWAQNGYHKDTDMVFSNGTVLPGPTLPTARIDLCAVELHDGRVLIMGKPLIFVINLVLVVMCKKVRLKIVPKDFNIHGV